MEIVFLPGAKAELMDAISYYNRQSEGLGYGVCGRGEEDT